MNDVVLVREVVNRVITVNDKIVAVTKKENPSVITIGIQGPAGPAGNTTFTLIAATALSGHKVITTDENGKAIYGSNNNLAHANKIIGISSGAADQNASISIRTYGEMEEPSWNWDITKPIYVGLNGALTQAVPSSGFILQVASPITAAKIFVDIKQTIIIN